jgi:hypothetical protein
VLTPKLWRLELQIRECASMHVNRIGLPNFGKLKSQDAAIARRLRHCYWQAHANATPVIKAQLR